MRTDTWSFMRKRNNLFDIYQRKSVSIAILYMKLGGLLYLKGFLYKSLKQQFHR